MDNLNEQKLHGGQRRQQSKDAGTLVNRADSLESKAFAFPCRMKHVLTAAMASTTVLASSRDCDSFINIYKGPTPMEPDFPTGMKRDWIGP